MVHLYADPEELANLKCKARLAGEAAIVVSSVRAGAMPSRLEV